MSTSLLPSVLPSRPSVPDVDTTPAQLAAAQTFARVTSPKETPLFICALDQCYRLFPSHERVMAHRKRDHQPGDDNTMVITWNE